MSLLWMEHEQEFQNLVEKANICEQEAKPEYFAALPTRVKRIIYRDSSY